jgi:retron-type reverse transcriptase
MRVLNLFLWVFQNAFGVFLALVALFALLFLIFGMRHWLKLRTNLRPWQALRARLGWGLGTDELARRLDCTVDALTAHTPDYAESYIPKRSGGARRLDIPDRRTKDLQRRILHRLLARLRAHQAAMGFERGRSIVHNALPHVGQAVVLRLDVIDFFPTTRDQRIERWFRRVGWNREAAELLVKLTTYKGGLPQGAPTSPRLSNLVNYYLDVQLTKLAARRGGVYTRFADDITISFPKDRPRRIRGVIQQVSRLLRVHGYRIHRRRKLHIRRRHQRQEVTGLVVNDKVQLPRATRRWLRAVRHRLASGQPASLTPAQLRGWTGVERMIDRQAVESS